MAEINNRIEEVKKILDKNAEEARHELIKRLTARCEQLIDQLKLADKNYTDLKSAFDERIEEAKREAGILRRVLVSRNKLVEDLMVDLSLSDKQFKKAMKMRNENWEKDRGFRCQKVV